MTGLRKIISKLGVAGLVATPMLVAGLYSGAAFAGADENAYMARLVGAWSGRSTINFIERGTQESVLCKLTVKPKGSDKLTLGGACALAGAKLQFKSTLGYSDKNSRFETVLKSNTAYDGEASGTLGGDVLTFEMPVYDEKVRKPYLATVVLIPNGDALTLDFNFAEESTGKRTSEVSIPLKR